MAQKSLIVNGWRLFAAPCFLDAVETTRTAVLQLQQKHPEKWVQKKAAKRLAMIVRLVLKDIPEDPTREIYRQGTTLGGSHRHWRRAKFYQQYRLFFRYHSARKIIVYGWVNDDTTLRAYESKTDAYRVFKKMLADGHPPNDWDELLAAARQESQRLKELLEDT